MPRRDGRLRIVVDQDTFRQWTELLRIWKLARADKAAHWRTADALLAAGLASIRVRLRRQAGKDWPILLERARSRSRAPAKPAAIPPPTPLANLTEHGPG